MSEKRNAPAGTRANRWEITNESSTVAEMVDRERAYRAAGSAHARRDSRWAPEFDPYKVTPGPFPEQAVLGAVLTLDAAGLVGVFPLPILRKLYEVYPEHKDAIVRMGRGNVA